MGDKSAIEWTDATWNPIVGCSVVSPGCTNCYAMKTAGRWRLKSDSVYAGLTNLYHSGAVWNGKLALSERALQLPLQWKRPRTIFVNSMGDVFHEAAPDAWIDKVFAAMALAPHHTYQLLTKRSARMLAYMTDERTYQRILSAAETFRSARGELCRIPISNPRDAAFWPQLWLGVSAEDQTRANERIPDLLATPAAVRWVSYEPALGAIDLSSLPFIGGDPRHRQNALTGKPTMYATGLADQPDFTVLIDVALPKIDWIVCGAESGPRARPMHPEWARSVRDQCGATGVQFFMKQLSGPGGRAIKDIALFPEDLRVRQFPNEK